MQGVVGAGGEQPVDGDQVLHPAHLAGQDDVVRGQAQFDRAGGAGDGGLHHGLVHHLLGLPGVRRWALASIMRTIRSWSRLPQLTPMRTGRS